LLEALLYTYNAANSTNVGTILKETLCQAVIYSRKSESDS